MQPGGTDRERARVPLPPPIMTSEPGSFARRTIVERKPAIIADVLSGLSNHKQVAKRLRDLQSEISRGHVTPPPAGIPLYYEWLAEWQQWEGRTWLEIPWYFAEAYFYVRLLSAIGYFEGLVGDPFEDQKRVLLGHCGAILPSLGRTQEAVSRLAPPQAFAALARRSLWGNRLDLSNVAITDRHRHDPSHLDDADLVVDHCPAAYETVSFAPGRPVTFLCDNCGPELLADLHLADWLLRNATGQVILEVKPQPFFVSDAMPKEVEAMLQFLAHSDEPEARRLAVRLERAIGEERLLVRSHPFWTGPHHYTRLPADLAACLAASSLVISKGDVNYRRFLEDRQWPFQTPIEDIVDYFPASVLLLRTFKGELAAGLDDDSVRRLAREDPEWLISGRHGVAQFAPRASGRRSCGCRRA